MRKYDPNSELSKTAARDLGYLELGCLVSIQLFITAYKYKDKIFIDFIPAKYKIVTLYEILTLNYKVVNSEKYTPSPKLIKRVNSTWRFMTTKDDINTLKNTNISELKESK